jgi:translation initiation factor IF-2
MLAPQFKEVILGHAEIRTIFNVSSIGTIAGSYVTDGKIVRNATVRLLRDNVVVHEGSLASLKRFKDDVKEVASGYECGFTLKNYNDIKEGDVIEAFEMQEIER